MPCFRFKVSETTLWQAKEDAGFEHGWSASHNDRVRRESNRLICRSDEEILAEQVAVERSTILPGGLHFMCGSKELDVQVCACGYGAGLLCDYPVGRGKTCDLAMCESCAREVSEDRHLCVIHFAEFVKKSGSRRINPWPPRGA